MKKIIKFGGIGLSKKCNIYFIRNTFNLGMIVSIQNKIGRKYVKLLPIYKIKEYFEYNYL
jgi:hypothetical protein